MPETERQRQLNDLVRDEVARVIIRDIELPKGTLVTVVRADVSSTVEHARVWVSVLPAERGAEVLAVLVHRIGEIQKQINRRLVLRTVPKLLLKLDTHAAHAEEVQELLDSLPPAT